MSEIDLSRLPKYAQDLIRNLQGELKQLHTELEAQKQSAPSRVRWGRAFRDISAGGFLRDDEQVYFMMRHDPQCEIRVALNKNGLYVNGDDRLYLTFEATNACTISVSP